MKKQILLLSMIASSGVFADIEWVDEHEPCYVDFLQDNSVNDIFEEHEDFNLHEITFHQEEEDSEVLVDTDFILEESSLEEIAAEDEEIPQEVIAMESSDPLIAVVDFDIDDESEKEGEKKGDSSEEELIFVTRGFAHKEPIKEEMVFVSKGVAYKQPIKESEEEIAYHEPNRNDHQIVDIAEVGPFSQFSIRGQSAKVAINADPKEIVDPVVEMIYFSPEDSSQEGFYLSPKKVTNREYERFVKETHHRPPPHWSKGEIPQGLEDNPVVNVTYKDAFLYSVWAGKRLPKEAELIQVVKSDQGQCDIDSKMGEWTSTPSIGKNGASRGASHLTINSELSRITYHKVFLGDCSTESLILDSNSYNSNTGFRVAVSKKL